jgi:hypothetical protein
MFLEFFKKVGKNSKFFNKKKLTTLLASPSLIKISPSLLEKTLIFFFFLIIHHQALFLTISKVLSKNPLKITQLTNYQKEIFQSLIL